MSNRIYYSSEAETRAKQERAVWSIASLAIGMVCGAVLSLLFAPKDDYRRIISEAIEEGVQRGRSTVRETARHIEDYPVVRSVAQKINGMTHEQEQQSEYGMGNNM